MNAVPDSPSIGEVTPEVLAGLDLIPVIDTSRSTDTESKRYRGQSRLDEMREEVAGVVAKMGRYDSDGVTLITFGGEDATVIDNVTPQRAQEILRGIKSGGGTPLDQAIRAIGQKAASSTKPCVAVIWTDGEPNNRRAVIDALRDVAKLTGGRPKLGITIVQVGDDPGATAYLKHLDNDLGGEGIPDMLAAVSLKAAEGLSLENLVWLAQNK